MGAVGVYQTREFCPAAGRTPRDQSMNDVSLPYEPITTTAPQSQAANRRAIAFLNLAHAIDHFVLLIFPPVVIGLEAVFKHPYPVIIALSTAAFLAFCL